MGCQPSSALPASSTIPKNPADIVAIRESFAVPNIEDEPEPDYLKDALRIVRGETMLLATRKHLSALSQDREELLLTLESVMLLFADITKEIEASFGELPATRLQIASLRKRIEIGRAL